MTLFISVPEQNTYDVLHAQWESFAEPKPFAEPTPPVPYDGRQAEMTEHLEGNSGHIVAEEGMFILESTVVAGNIFVVHQNDIANPTLWRPA